ncbi:MAG: hypothetical protein KDD22_01990 [Bdellovibrionales bacterium]|nr:hypothetical protein [Bdellovibrionales bacterium]
MKKLYLVDVSSFFFRAFFAIPPLTNSEGLPTNALYGFMSMTLKLLRDIRPDYMVYCLDRKEPSFRKEMYEDYKANRDEMPDDLVPQVPYIKKITEALGIPWMDKEGYEADDIIGSLCRWGRQNNLEVVIVSGDKDFAQLIAPYVTMFDTMKDLRYDEEGVKKKWGVRPDQFIDYLALVGDSSDNIPGVRGIGPKGAEKLLGEFESLEGVYQNIESISAKGTKAKLLENKDMAFLSQKLVSIATEMDLEINLNKISLQPIRHDVLQDLMQFLGFQSFLKKLEKDVGDSGSKSAEKSIETSYVSAGPEVKAYELVEVDLATFDKLVEPYSEIWALSSERGLAFSLASKLYWVSESPEAI